MRKLVAISLFVLLSCEEVVTIDLPQEQNLLVVEGWISNENERQYVRLSRSNNFSGNPNPIIENSLVSVQIRNDVAHSYTYNENGNYLSDIPFAGQKDSEYRLSVVMANGDLIQSEWTIMQAKTEISLLSIDSFEENDPDNSGQTKTIFFPRITARDSANFNNYYRWVLYRNNFQITDPESITLQNDRFFDGNFIPNLFDSFEYSQNDEMKVELHSISSETYDYLNLLKSQITTLGAAASTTPAIVIGNIRNITKTEEMVLGFFGTRAISADSVIVR